MRVASDRRVAWGILVVALLLGGVVLRLQQGAWEPAYTDYGQEGERYTFPLNGKIAEVDGVHIYWARCGHNELCGPIAFRGPAWGLSHVVLKVPSRDPAASTTLLPEPLPADCGWRGDCPDANTTTTTVTHAWGPYEQAPVRLQQAAVALVLMALAFAVANLARGPAEGVRAFAAMGAGALLAAGLPLDGTGLFIFIVLLVLPTLLAAFVFSVLARRWPLAGRLSSVLLWAILAWLVQTTLFISWFPGPPDA